MSHFKYQFITFSTKRIRSSLISFNSLQQYCTIKGPNDETIAPVDLAYATYENQDTDKNQDSKRGPPLLMLHGYLASKRNWVYICKRILATTKQQRKVIAVDLRNHGDSAHSTDHTNSHVLQDVKYFLDSFQIKTTAVLGHSYGGIAAMLLSLFYPDLIEKLIVEDITPKDQRKNLKQIKEALEAASKVTIPAKIPMSTARSLVNQQLAKDIPNQEYRNFLLTQLIQKSDGNFSWRFNVDVLKETVVKTGSFPEIRGKVFENPTLFLAGEKSSFVKKSDEPDIKKYFPNAEIHYIQQAGHTIHMDKPNEFINICVEFLDRQ